MSTQLLAIKTRFTDDTGAPLKGGRVYTFYAGTSTPKETYKDVDLLIPNTNPVLLDDTGAADIYLKGSYRIRVLDRFGALIEEQDDVSKIISRVDAGELVASLVGAITSLSDTKSEIDKVKLDTGITATQKHTGSITRTLSEKIDDVVNLRDFGLVTADSSIIAAANFAMSSQRSFTIDSNIIIKIPEHFPDLQTALTRITPSKGVIITLRISTGHKINQPVKLLEGGDYSSFYIESVDPVVYLKDDWLPTDNLFTLTYAKSPRIKALFDMQGKGVDGVNASRASTAYVGKGWDYCSRSYRCLYKLSINIIRSRDKF